MQPARPSALARWIFSRYLKRLFRRSFHRISLTGEHHLLNDDHAYPVILYSNHQSWWDGLLEYRLTEYFNADLRLLMDEKNLRDFPFFRRVGVFGVDLEDPRDRTRGLLHAIKLLREPSRRRMLILFPQGELRPAHEPFRPFAGGIETLLKKSPQAKVFPLGKTLHFGRYQRPEVHLHLGKPVSAEASLKELQAALEHCLPPHLSSSSENCVDFLPPHPKDLRRAGR